MQNMLTNAEIRRIRLIELIDRYGSVAALNRAIGWESTDTRIGRIKNRTNRGERGPEKTYNMGDAMAREIESSLGLEVGFLDNLTNEQEAALNSDESALLDGFRHASSDIKSAMLTIAHQALLGKKSSNQRTGT